MSLEANSVVSVRGSSPPPPSSHELCTPPRKSQEPSIAAIQTPQLIFSISTHEAVSCLIGSQCNYVVSIVLSNHIRDRQSGTSALTCPSALTNIVSLFKFVLLFILMLACC